MSELEECSGEFDFIVVGKNLRHQETISSFHTWMIETASAANGANARHFPACSGSAVFVNASVLSLA